MTEEAYRKYRKAGEILRKAMKYALDNIEEGEPLLKMANNIERLIRRYNAMPAFPVNISQNNIAAHYSPGINDRSVILKGAVVKVDIGVQVDGYIADAAVTISFNPSYERLVKAAKEALSKVQNILRPGVPLRNAGKIVKDVAEKWGVRPIANLSGHKVERYNLHAGKTVPNVPSWDISRAEEGEVYAVEPFMTNGEGLVVEGGEGHIYRVKSMKKVKDKELVEALNLIWRRYKSLPFSERWLLDAFEDPLDIIKRLVQKSRIYSYPALLERSGGIVTQYEDTFIVHDKEAEALVRVINLV